jgi:hypothetical protein
MTSAALSTATSNPVLIEAAVASTAAVKRKLLEQLLQEHPAVEVYVDDRQPGVQLGEGPHFLSSFVTLLYGQKLQVPIPDLRTDEQGIHATLCFGRQSRATSVPWSAIFAFEARLAPYQNAEKPVCWWPESFPKKLLQDQHDGALAAILSRIGSASPPRTTWSALPAPVREALRDGGRVTNDQRLITDTEVRWLSSAAADLLLRIDRAMHEGGTGKYWGSYDPAPELPAQQRGAEKRQIETLYHKGLLNRSRPSVQLLHALSPEARMALERLAKKEYWKREQQVRSAAQRAVDKDERAGYAEALGLKKFATPHEIVSAMLRLRNHAVEAENRLHLVLARDEIDKPVSGLELAQRRMKELDQLRAKLAELQQQHDQALPALQRKGSS